MVYGEFAGKNRLKLQVLRLTMLQFFNKKTGQRGFTLIELLVVIAIIGILATIVLVSLNSARQKARDTRRVSDLRQIQLGEEIYYDSNGTTYAANLAALATGGAMAAVPNDPSDGSAYAYCADAANTVYAVGMLLEDITSSLLNTSVAEDNLTSCTWAGGVRNAKGTNSCGAAGYYCVAP